MVILPESQDAPITGTVHAACDVQETPVRRTTSHATERFANNAGVDVAIVVNGIIAATALRAADQRRLVAHAR